jgi:glucokinase
MAEAGRRLGEAMALLVDLLNPEVIVLGSLYVRARDLLEGPMREAMEAEALPHALAACAVEPAALGERLREYEATAAGMYREAEDEFSVLSDGG